MPSDPICRHPDCLEVATHVLVTDGRTWTRAAVLASAAPEIHPTVTTSAQPIAYYCFLHAEAKAYAPGA